MTPMNSGGANFTINHHQPAADEQHVGGELERTITHVR